MNIAHMPIAFTRACSSRIRRSASSSCRARIGSFGMMCSSRNAFAFARCSRTAAGMLKSAMPSSFAAR